MFLPNAAQHPLFHFHSSRIEKKKGSTLYTPPIPPGLQDLDQAGQSRSQEAAVLTIRQDTLRLGMTGSFLPHLIFCSGDPHQDILVFNRDKRCKDFHRIFKVAFQ